MTWTTSADNFGGMTGKWRQRGASAFNDRHRVTADDIKARFAERDQREASDHRTPAQQWLNDPPPLRSALAMKGRKKPDAA